MQFRKKLLISFLKIQMNLLPGGEYFSKEQLLYGDVADFTILFMALTHQHPSLSSFNIFTPLILLSFFCSSLHSLTHSIPVGDNIFSSTPPTPCPREKCGHWETEIKEKSCQMLNLDAGSWKRLITEQNCYLLKFSYNLPKAAMWNLLKSF